MKKKDTKKQEARTRLYNLGLSDKEIAEFCGDAESAITSWRQRNRLEKNNNTELLKRVAKLEAEMKARGEE